MGMNYGSSKEKKRLAARAVWQIWGGPDVRAVAWHNMQSGDMKDWSHNHLDTVIEEARIQAKTLNRRTGLMRLYGAALALVNEAVLIGFSGHWAALVGWRETVGMLALRLSVFVSLGVLFGRPVIGDVDLVVATQDDGTKAKHLLAVEYLRYLKEHGEDIAARSYVFTAACWIAAVGYFVAFW